MKNIVDMGARGKYVIWPLSTEYSVMTGIRVISLISCIGTWPRDGVTGGEWHVLTLGKAEG